MDLDLVEDLEGAGFRTEVAFIAAKHGLNLCHWDDPIFEEAKEIVNRHTIANKEAARLELGFTENVEDLAKELGEVVVDSVKDLLKDSADDLAPLTLEITRGLSIALLNKDATLADELKAQLQGVLELQKIKGAKKVNETINRVIDSVLKTVGATLNLGRKLL